MTIDNNVCSERRKAKNRAQPVRPPRPPVMSPAFPDDGVTEIYENVA